jgi:hypothetical protein
MKTRLLGLMSTLGSENGFQPYRPTVVVEHRYLTDIVAGIQNDGLAVQS